MIKVTKNVITDSYCAVTGKTYNFTEPHFSITINEFKNDNEASIIFSKVKQLINEWESKRKVF